MIEFKKCPVIDGKAFASIEEAQKYELEALLAAADFKFTPATQSDVANFLLTNRGRLLDIITTSDSSRPKARKLHGGTKKRKAATATPATEA